MKALVRRLMYLFFWHCFGRCHPFALLCRLACRCSNKAYLQSIWKDVSNWITLWVVGRFFPEKEKGYTEAERTVSLVFITVSNGQPEDRRDYVAAKNTVQTCTTRFPFEAGSLPGEMDMAAAEATIIFHTVKYCHTFQGWTTLSKLHSVNDISLYDHLKIPCDFFSQNSITSQLCSYNTSDNTSQ